MNSMTGFGRGTATLGSLTISVQANSVNRRGLDLSVALPDAWESLESAVTDAVRAVVSRGKVHVAIEVGGNNGSGEWDEAAVGEALDRLKDLAASRGVPFNPSADLLWEIANSRGEDGLLVDAPEAWTTIEEALAEALRGLGAMRAREGEALMIDFLGRLGKLHTHVEAIALRSPQLTGTYREQLMQRLRAAGLELELNDERVLKEIALFADRVDVTEEITRLRSHLSQLKDLLRSDGEVGRKAEFILQEIGREIHTIGSKANDLQISQRVIECKNELERVREQMANVE